MQSIITISLIISLITTVNACVDCPYSIKLNYEQVITLNSPICDDGTTAALDRFTITSDNYVALTLLKSSSNIYNNTNLLPSPAQQPLHHVSVWGLTYTIPGNRLMLGVACVYETCNITYGYAFSCKSLTSPNWWASTWGEKCRAECYQTREVMCFDASGNYVAESRCTGPKPSSYIRCMEPDCTLNADAFHWVQTTNNAICNAQCMIINSYICVDHSGSQVDGSFCDMVNPIRPAPINCGNCDASSVHWIVSADWTPCDESCTSYRNVTCWNARYQVDESLCIASGVPKLLQYQTCKEKPCLNTALCNCYCKDGQRNLFSDFDCDADKCNTRCNSICSITKSATCNDIKLIDSSFLFKVLMIVFCVAFVIIFLLNLAECCWRRKQPKKESSITDSDYVNLAAQ